MITVYHAGGKLGGVGRPDISLEGVHKCCQGSSWATLAVGWLLQNKVVRRSRVSSPSLLQETSRFVWNLREVSIEVTVGDMVAPRQLTFSTTRNIRVYEPSSHFCSEAFDYKQTNKKTVVATKPGSWLTFILKFGKWQYMVEISEQMKKIFFLVLRYFVKTISFPDFSNKMFTLFHTKLAQKPHPGLRAAHTRIVIWGEHPPPPLPPRVTRFFSRKLHVAYLKFPYIYLINPRTTKLFQ